MCTPISINNKKNNNNRIQRRNSRFFTISSQRRELSPTRTLKWPGRNRVQTTCTTSSARFSRASVMLRATWYEGTAQLLSLTELKSHLFELYFIGWTIKPMEGRKPEYPEKTPGDELQKMPRTTARGFKPQARLEPAQQLWWQARKADMLTVTPRVAPHPSFPRTCVTEQAHKTWPPWHQSGYGASCPPVPSPLPPPPPPTF